MNAVVCIIHDFKMGEKIIYCRRQLKYFLLLLHSYVWLSSENVNSFI